MLRLYHIDLGAGVTDDRDGSTGDPTPTGGTSPPRGRTGPQGCAHAGWASATNYRLGAQRGPRSHRRHSGEPDYCATTSRSGCGHILEIAYHVLRDGVAYEELGTNYYGERKKDAVVRNAVKRLERLGYKVTVAAA